MSKRWIFDPIEKRKFYDFSNIKWISDTQFTYHEIIYHDKFQHDVDGITEYLFDIPSKTSVLKKVIKADTYVYQPGKDA